MRKRSDWIKCVVAISLCLAAISCKRDYGSTPEQKFVDNFKAMVMGSKEIDSHQDWNTVGNAIVNISVDYGNEAEYTVYISQSPLILDANAVYIGMARLKSGDSKIINIARPANSPLLYAACYDAEGHAACKPFSIINGTADVIFSGKSPQETLFYSSSTGNRWSVPARSLPDLSAYTTGTLYGPTDPVDLNDEDEVHFQVNSDFTGFIPSLGTYQKKSVYVTAVWTLSFNQQVLRNNVLIVGAGGTIVVPKNYKLSTTPMADENAGLIYVLPGGNITGDGTVDFATTDGIYSYNAGTITTKTLNINCCMLYNAGTIGGTTVGTKITCTADSLGTPSILANAGSVYVSSLADENLSVENAGYINVTGELTLSRPSKMDDGSYIECKNLNLNGDISGDKVLYMGNAAYLRCYGNLSIDNFGVQGPVGDGFKANAVLNINKCNYCATTDGVAGTYLLDHVELIVPTKFPTIFDKGALNTWDGDKHGVGIGKLQETFSGYHNLRMLYYWMNGREGRALDVDNYEWTLVDDKYCFVGTDALNNGIDASRQTCTYSIAPSYNTYLFSKEETGTIPDFGSVYYLFETLNESSKDFDYNDVVIRVNTPIDNGDGTFTANVQIVCVGNKTKSTILYKDEVFGEEVHAAIGIDVNSTVNNSTVNRTFRKLGEIIFTDGNFRTELLDFSLSIEDEDGDITSEKQPSTLGTAPLYLVINGNRAGKCFWPIEANNIGIAYPQFSEWGSNVQTSIDWYDSSNAAKGKIVSY